jgi:hypothetical protein
VPQAWAMPTQARRARGSSSIAPKADKDLVSSVGAARAPPKLNFAPDAYPAPTVPNGWASSDSSPQAPLPSASPAASHHPYPARVPLHIGKLHGRRLKHLLLCRHEHFMTPPKQLREREARIEATIPLAPEKAVLHGPPPPAPPATERIRPTDYYSDSYPPRSPRQELSARRQKKVPTFHRKSRCRDGTRSLPSHPLSHVYLSDSCQSECSPGIHDKKKAGHAADI